MPLESITPANLSLLTSREDPVPCRVYREGGRALSGFLYPGLDPFVSVLISLGEDGHRLEEGDFPSKYIPESGDRIVLPKVGSDGHTELQLLLLSKKNKDSMENGWSGLSVIDDCPIPKLTQSNLPESERTIEIDGPVYEVH